MVQVHMTEAEVAGNFAAALEKVHQGLEVVVEHDHQAIAVLKPAEPPHSKISESIAMLPADSTAIIDPDFAADVEASRYSRPPGSDPRFLRCRCRRTSGQECRLLLEWVIAESSRDRPGEHAAAIASAFLLS